MTSTKAHYRAYLKSPVWKKKREAKMKKAIEAYKKELAVRG